MNLSSLANGKSATVIAINANKALKQRFNAFGLTKGTIVTIQARSLAKKTIEIRINKTLIALRSDEAENIEVIE